MEHENKAKQPIPYVRAHSTKVRILEAAVATINDHGYPSLTFGVVASTLGVSKGLVNYHYPSKEHMLIALLEYIAHDYGAYVTHAMQKTEPPLLLHGYVTAVFSYAIHHPERIKAAMDIAKHVTDQYDSDMGTLNQRIVKQLVQYIALDPKYTSYSSAEVQNIALIVKGAMDAYVVMWSSSGIKLKDPVEITDMLLNHIC
jgi:AcrR family transcriptional regulator